MQKQVNNLKAQAQCLEEINESDTSNNSLYDNMTHICME